MRYFLFLFTGICMFACTSDQNILPESTGIADEVVVVASDELWTRGLDKIIKEVFEKDFPGLPQSEPYFRIVHVTPKEFTSIFQSHKQILIISEHQKVGKQDDKWATPQLVIGMQWDLEQPKEQAIEKCKGYMEMFYKNRLKIEKAKIKLSSTFVENNFDIDIMLLNEYTIVQNDATLFWAVYNPAKSEMIKQILVFSIRPNEINFHENLIKDVDALLEKTIKGRKKQNFVQIEKRYPMEVSDSIYRGLWRMENDFMGGPFLMKIYQRNNEEMIVAMGLVFAPSANKRKWMIEMEATFN